MKDEKELAMHRESNAKHRKQLLTKQIRWMKHIGRSGGNVNVDVWQELGDGVSCWPWGVESCIFF